MARRAEERRSSFWRGPGWIPSTQPQRQPVSVRGERTAAWIALLATGLTLFGLVMVLSASSVTSVHQSESPFTQFERQLIFAVIGATLFLIGRAIDYRHLQRVSTPALVLGGLLLLITLVPGIGLEINGARRWLAIGPFSVQPAEFAKLALVVFVADLLARRARYMHRAEMTIRPVMVVLIVYCGLIVVQPKLGTTIVLTLVVMAMLFVAGAHIRHLASWAGLFAVAVGVLAVIEPYRMRRIVAFTNPMADPMGDGLQTLQSQVGIASGGLMGVGLGAGRTKWGFLPYADSDFIFALVAEEAGLLGAAGVILAFLLFGFLGIRVALNAADRFGMLLAMGITTWLMVQAFINIGMAIGLMPVTGEPLPFLSAGGSSLMVSLMASGLLANIARRGKK